MRLAGVLIALAAHLLLAVGPASAQGRAPMVRVLATDFVLPGKIARIAELGAGEGVGVTAAYVETGDPAQWLEGADLVILDTPRANDAAAVQTRADEALAASGKPWIQVGGGPPRFGGLPPEVARRMIGYYAGGGAENFRALMAYVRTWRSGGDLATAPPPMALPAHGVYHPDAPGPITSVEAYLAWGEGRWGVGAPVVAAAISSSMLSGMQTALADAVARRAEAKGMIPVVFWFDAADPQGISKALGGLRPAVLVNMTHMQNGAARAAEFLALDIPFLQTITYREGGAEAWRASPSGVSTQSAATFLAVPEAWGLSDPMVVAAIEDGEPKPIPDQLDALLEKARRLAALQTTAAADKRLALMFWNAPGGEKNLSASNLNIPRSLAALTRRLGEAGYDVPTTEEADLVAAGQALLAGYYRPETLDRLLAEDLAVTFPLKAYRAWLAELPEARRREVLERWGDPVRHWAVRTVAGEPAFVIPRLQLGKLMILPQPPRADRVGEAYHDVKQPPGHLYLATYLYVRERFQPSALVHFGTHGTQEWTPGKDRGLALHDYPFLAVGDLPVFYPYIQDNIGEAIQARRRGRAVTISHQTPPFAPAGLYDELRDLHALVHEYQQLDPGGVRDATADRLRGAAARADLDRDIGWTQAQAQADFEGFLQALHDHLHELARTAAPLGLHTFGEPASPEHRLTTVMQQLGEPYYRRLGLDPLEVFAEDHEAVKRSAPYRLLDRHLRDGAPLDEIADPQLRAMIARGRELDAHLAETGEVEALLAGLAGRFVAPGAGGDPVRNPDVPSGRNIYAFEPDKIPTQAAYEAGGKAFAQLLEAYRADHGGKSPGKLAFSMWSSETIRTLGVVEGQVLHALGLRPVWDRAGRVERLEIVPAAELGRPRIDAVLQITSVYRDQFDGIMRLLGEAIEQLAALDEPGNAVAENSRRLAAELVAQGRSPQEAASLSALRLFSNAPGDYGSGLPDAVLASDKWEETAPLADTFLTRLQYAYGAKAWGAETPGANLFASQLKGVDAAVLSRSSNLHGLLSTDHPFEYLGGLSLAIRTINGESPSLYVTDLRRPEGKVTGAARLLSEEMRVRYLNPHWIGAMKAEGYAGTVELVGVVNNLFGWQVTDPAMVRPDQWQAVHDTYVRDIRGLGVNRWFEQDNPTAQAQMIERMAEAIRKGYWSPDAATKRELAERWAELTMRHAADKGAMATAQFLETLAGGFGLSGRAAPAAPPPAKAPAEPPSPTSDTPAATPPPTVRGQLLQEVRPPAAPAAPDDLWGALAALAALLLAGGLWRMRANQRLQRVEFVQ
ncbi:MAG: cobaltochelatase subunit CobN [Phenylobacterium sp.]|uniref:cobaltochelatase subunit CobN n=1 Tax=Phenylobacterium sp. TaxID=1871053 RepID=UPI00391CFCC8